MHVRIAFVLAALVALASTASPQSGTVVVPEAGVAWTPLTLEIEGPPSSETGSPNPFTDVRLFVAFESGNERYQVPGYFAADGDAAQTGAAGGSVWRAHLVPTHAGTWSYEISFRGGERVALAPEPDAGAPLAGDGFRGSIEVAPAPEARGMLRYVGERYLRFAGTGEAFLKAGTDSPENFLAYDEFDGGREARGGEGTARADEAALAPRHAYAPHVGDWRSGDPSWGDGRGKGIIGALNYLADKGVNSVYFLTMNVEGDGDDVWPFRTRADRFRFDCSKLDQWEIVFSHMDALGMMLHVVLTETENESLFEHEDGGAFFADARRLYYRELIARFGHHSALTWNLGEENGWDDRGKGNTGPAGLPNSHEQRRAFADSIRSLDPYAHPIVVHTLPDRYDEIYTPLLGHPSIEGPSLQVVLGERIHTEVKRWIAASRAAGRPWVVTLDEIGPHTDGVKPDSVDPDHDDVRRFALWGTLMAGGAGVEWYFGYQYPHDDLGAEDFRSRDAMWDQTRIAVEFFQRLLPFESMDPCDALLDRAGAYCFAAPERVYAVYRPGNTEVNLRLPLGDYRVDWFDPRSGGELLPGEPEQVIGGGLRSIGEPPRQPDRDWVALLRRSGLSGGGFALAPLGANR